MIWSIGERAYCNLGRREGTSRKMVKELSLKATYNGFCADLVQP
jgi:hypothetical protein